MNTNKSTLIFFLIGAGLGLTLLMVLFFAFRMFGPDDSKDENLEDQESEIEVEEQIEEQAEASVDVEDIDGEDGLESKSEMAESDKVEELEEDADESEPKNSEKENEDESAGLYEEFMSKKTIKSIVDDINEIYWVVSIIDGDTLVVADQNNNEFQVRVLGVDTNEVNGKDSSAECYAYEATMFTAELLKDRAVRLRSDQENRDEDDFGRKLRFVDALQPDGSFVSLTVTLLSGGYAIYPDEYQLTTPDYYEYLEQEARDAGKGLWGACY